MSTAAHEDHAPESELIRALESGSEIDEIAGSPGGNGSKWLVRVVLLAVVVLVIAVLAGLAGTMNGKTDGGMITHTVKREVLLITITEDGTLESANNIDIKCEVLGGSTILEIVEDGKEVQEGEQLAKLDSAQIEDQISSQKIVFERARATKIQSEKTLAVAKLAVQEYLEGTYRQNSQTLDANITVAMENLRSAENTLQYTERMFRKGYASPLQLDAQKFAVQRAKLDLDTAKVAKDVLDRFTKAKTLEDLQSQVATAEAQASADAAAFQLEEARLKRLETQLTKCVIKTPRAGMVIYSNQQSSSRFGGSGGSSGSSSQMIELGAMVREQQTLFKFPDLANMQVKVTVHESNVDMITVDMRARVRVQDQYYQGTVIKIANQPEPSSFMSANVKEYATTVKIDGQPADIKPGMTAEVEILIAELEGEDEDKKGVLSLPVAAVVEQAGKFHCWVKKGDKVERRDLLLGMTNNKFIEVKDGVVEGEQVVLNPRAVVAEARHEEGGTEKVDVKARFGAAAEQSAAPSAGPAGPGESGGMRGERGDRGGMGGAAEGVPGEQGAVRGGMPGGPGFSAGEGEGGSGERRGGPGGPGGSGGSRMNLMDNDKDGDGKVSRDEAPERMAGFFDRIDTNADGSIDQSEADAMRSRTGSRGGGRPGEGGPGGGGFGGERSGGGGFGGERSGGGGRPEGGAQQ